MKLKKGYSDKAKNIINSWNYDEFTEHELTYSRKSWELVYALNCDTHNNCTSELTLDAWINLKEKLAPIGPSLERISDAFRAEYEDYDTPQDEYFRNIYKKWYDQSFEGDTPRLGYDFSVGYMMTFREAADEVLKYLEDPDWEVWMVASY